MGNEQTSYRLRMKEKRMIMNHTYLRCSSLAGRDIKFMPAHSFHIPSSYMFGVKIIGTLFLYSMTDANKK